MKAEPDGLKDSMTQILQMKIDKKAEPANGLAGLSSIKTEKPPAGLSALTTFGAPPKRPEPSREEKRQKP